MRSHLQCSAQSRSARRGRSPLLPLLAVLIGLAGCTFDAEKSDLNVEVTNIAQNEAVNHLIVTLTLPDASTHTYQPTFGAQSNSSIALSLATGGQTGAYTLKIEQFDRNATSFGVVTIPNATHPTATLPETGTVPAALPDAL
jgi:hypothetical protein